MAQQTINPTARSTRPPSPDSDCAYADLIAAVRESAPRLGVALAAAVVTEHLGSDVQAALAERLYNVVKETT